MQLTRNIQDMCCVVVCFLTCSIHDDQSRGLSRYYQDEHQPFGYQGTQMANEDDDFHLLIDSRVLFS